MSENEQLMHLQKELQSLKLELQGRDASVRSMSNEIERLQKNEQQKLELTLNGEFEKLFTDISGPVSQLLTQEALSKTNANISAADVLILVRQLVRSLERNGLEIKGKVDDKAEYHSGFHEILTSTSLSEGQAVRVKIPGIGFKGKVVRKAMVTEEEKAL